MGDQKQQMFTRSIDIPSLPSGMASIVSVASSESATADDVANAILLDPALSTKVLRMANSAFYGRLTKAETVTQAVVTLGFSAVKTVALAASVVDHVLPEKGVPGLSWKAFWQHCVATGAAAEIISRHLTGSKRGGESAFVAGLLHDIGKLIIARNAPDQFAKAVWIATDTNADMCFGERKVFGTDHSTVGALLAQEWRIPEAIAGPVGLHHSTDTDASPVVISVRGANVLSKAMYGGYLTDCKIQVTAAEVTEACGLNEETIRAVAQEVPQRLAECGEVLSWAGNMPEGGGLRRAA
ncbi:MAG: HDOD domain-containing protein [Armatimonadota bacterium]